MFEYVYILIFTLPAITMVADSMYTSKMRKACNFYSFKQIDEAMDLKAYIQHLNNKNHSMKHLGSTLS